MTVSFCLTKPLQPTPYSLRFAAASRRGCAAALDLPDSW